MGGGPSRARSHQFHVPPVLGWDGQPITMWRKETNIPISGFTSANGPWAKGPANVNAEYSMKNVQDAILAADTAGKGFKVKAVFIPVKKYGGKLHGIAEDADFKGFGSMDSRAQLFFHRLPSEPADKVETIFLNAEINIQDSWLGSETASGYDGLHEKLHAAAQDGFELSAVIDDPSIRVAGFMSYTTTVELVCQRIHGQPIMQRQYKVVNVPMYVQPNCDCVKADMPTLLQMLKHHGSSGHRVASIYSPPGARGAVAGKLSCHVIFEKTTVNYQMSVVESMYTVSPAAMGGSVDHSEYTQVISKWYKQGWELAAMVDMPDRWNESCFKQGSTMLLVFQHPCPP